MARDFDQQLFSFEVIEQAGDLTEIEFFHFLCDHPEIVDADGAATEAMYTGKQAMKSVGTAARNEIFALFPELWNSGSEWDLARPTPCGHKVRRLVWQLQKHGRQLIG